MGKLTELQALNSDIFTFSMQFIQHNPLSFRFFLLNQLTSLILVWNGVNSTGNFENTYNFWLFFNW